LKTTYKLLGVFWDGRPSLSFSLPEFKEVILPRNYSCKYDLFDTTEYIRSIRVSDLLSIESFKKIQFIIKQLFFCEKIVILFDETLNINNPTIKNLLDKRISQCIHYVHEAIPKAKIFKASITTHS